uniref:Follicle-stimulating hormone receptor n=1 Tax=Lygus hesperus TaxID=30085 RepID=A0A0A9Y3Y5_LYGHE
MLLRLLHHIMLHDKKAVQLTLSALDEYVHFLTVNTSNTDHNTTSSKGRGAVSEEAAAVVERQRLHEAVTKLLITLDEEGMLADHRCSFDHHNMSKSLADKVTNMVHVYRTQMQSSTTHFSHPESSRCAKTPSCVAFFDELGCPPV